MKEVVFITNASSFHLLQFKVIKLFTDTLFVILSFDGVLVFVRDQYFLSFARKTLLLRVVLLDEEHFTPAQNAKIKAAMAFIKIYQGEDMLYNIVVII